MDSRPSSSAKQCETAFPILMFKNRQNGVYSYCSAFLMEQLIFWIVSVHFLRLSSFHYKRLWYNTKDGIYFYPIIRLYAGQKPLGTYVYFLCFWLIPGYYIITLVGKHVCNSSPEPYLTEDLLVRNFKQKPEYFTNVPVPHQDRGSAS